MAAQAAEKSISNSVEKLQDLATWLGEWVKANDVDGSIAYKLRFAMEEIASNAVFYGFPTGTSGTVTVRINALTEDNGYQLEILDDGEAFNPLEDSPEVDADSPLDEREPGGLGVFLVKNLSEDCHYHRVDGWNHLTIIIQS